MINKIINYAHPKIYYHHFCEVNFSYKISLNKNTKKSHWHDLREHHQVVFDEMCAFIRENIIEKGRFYFLTYLHRYYMDLFKESAAENSEEISGNFTPHNLENKIMKVFSKDIKFFSIRNKKILASKHITSIDDQSFENLKDENILNTAALLLRKSCFAWNVAKEFNQ